jgi:RimJ/RimL family protein N-acetyltransferase
MVGNVVVRLDNGREVVVRPIRPQDKPLLATGFARLSHETARRRFLAPKDHLTVGELRFLTEVDFRDHVAFVAVLAEDPQTMVGVGRWIRVPGDPEAAEVAYLVADDLQGHGLGTAIATALADAALERGVRRFVATMLPENAAARRLLAHVSRDVRTRIVGGVQEVEGRLVA